MSWKGATSTRPTTTTVTRSHGSLSRRRVEDRRVHRVEEGAGLLARPRVSEDRSYSFPLRLQHDDTYQFAQGGRGASRSTRAVGQGPRARESAWGATQPGAGQWL